MKFLSGYKTYIIGILGLVYGYFYKDPNAAIMGAGMIMLRLGVSTSLRAIIDEILASELRIKNSVYTNSSSTTVVPPVLPVVPQDSLAQPITQ
ncbi:MAG: hypothetical protein ACYC6W_11745 [Nitrosotalea sp.]